MHATLRLSAIALVAAVAVVSCKARAPDRRVLGQTDFLSAPPAGGGGTTLSAGGAGGAPAAGGTASGGAGQARAVEETDVYRLDGDRLYVLDAYRGLLVFDVSDADQPRLLGRHAIFGSPVQMVVRDGFAVVVVADWTGADASGAPFHGSVVRGLDARDPAHLRTTGEAQLAGWVRDLRVVGDVLYAVSEQLDFGGVAGVGAGTAGPAGGTGGAGPTGRVVVSSVSFAGGSVAKVGELAIDGWQGVINVSAGAILLASEPGAPWTGKPDAKLRLQSIDISDPGGAIRARGALQIPGAIASWGADAGRWNLDFDGRFARVLGCGQGFCGGAGATDLLSTVDFSNPDAPVLVSTLEIPSAGGVPAVRFDGGRLYLAPDQGFAAPGARVEIAVYDVSDPAHPHLSGTTPVDGALWSFFPAGARAFTLGRQGAQGSELALGYLDVSAPQPALLGTARFGDGWAWTPAAGTFKAFTYDAARGLVVLPFSSWSEGAGYQTGLQIIDVTARSIATAGAAHTHGWVERGVFVGARLYSLSDLSLAVIDFTDHRAPRVVTELALARNVVSAQPAGDELVELDSDWFGHQPSSTTLRVRPLDDAEDDRLAPALAEAQLDGAGARVYRNGDLAYVVTQVASPGSQSCGGPGGKAGVGVRVGCLAWTQQVQVVDLAGGGARLRGKIALPPVEGWLGEDGPLGWWSWFEGEQAVQAAPDAIAFRRWTTGGAGRDPARSALYLVDLRDPDAPALSAAAVADPGQGWWGNLLVSGGSLWASEYLWVSAPNGTGAGTVRYFADRFDLSDRAHPRIAARINVPGVLVGGPPDPSILYTVDYRWNGQEVENDLAAVQLRGDRAALAGEVAIEGWVGRVLVRGTTAYLTAITYPRAANGSKGAPTYLPPELRLHQVELADPLAPTDAATSARAGFGWLAAVEGDRALVTSGWGSGLDVYRLAAGAAPAFDRFVRTLGWWPQSIARQDGALYVASGYWGVQRIPLR